MSDFEQMQQMKSGTPASIQNALDAVDRADKRHRIKIVLVIIGVFAATIWFDRSARDTAMPLAERLTPAVILIAAILTLVAERLRYTMNKNTKTILRAIAALKQQ